MKGLTAMFKYLSQILYLAVLFLFFTIFQLFLPKDIPIQNQLSFVILLVIFSLLNYARGYNTRDKNRKWF